MDQAVLNCRIFWVVQGSILERYKVRDGWPWLPGKSVGAGKTWSLLLQGCACSGGCLYNCVYKAIQKLLVPSSEKVPQVDINPSQNFYPFKTNFDPEKCDNCNGLVLWVCTELFYFRYSLKFTFLLLFFFFQSYFFFFCIIKKMINEASKASRDCLILLIDNESRVPGTNTSSVIWNKIWNTQRTIFNYNPF